MRFRRKVIPLPLLIILAALALPHTAHALCSSPPCSYSVTIRGAQSGVSNSPQQQTFTITSSSTSGPAIAVAGCDPNPPHNGGPTNGSCFTNQIVNMDFSGATQSFVGPSGNFDASNINNWLSAPGGGGCTPSYAAFTSSQSGGYQTYAPPCSAFSIVNDEFDGKPALQMQMTQAMLNGFTGDVAMITSVGHYGVLIPATSFYYKFQWHTDATAIANMNNMRSQDSNINPFTGAFNAIGLTSTNNHTTWNGNEIGAMEWDALEGHLPNVGSDTDAAVGNSYGHFYDYPAFWCASYYGPSYGNAGGCTVPVPISSYNPSTGWTTFEGRATSDAAGNWAECVWVNGVFGTCQTDTFNQNTCGNDNHGGAGTLPCNSINGAVAGLLIFGPSLLYDSPQPSTPGPINSYYRDIEVWTCQAQKTAYDVSSGAIVINGSLPSPNPCAGVVLTTNP